MGGITTTLFQRPRDPQFNNTTLLLSGNFPTNGAQNNTFLDSSSNGFSITRNGNTTQGSFSPFSQTGWSNYFNGTNAYLTVANATAINLSSGDFTIEAWVYWTGTNASPKFIDKDGVFGSTYSSYSVALNSSGYAIFEIGSGNGISSIQTLTSNTLLPKNSFVHLAAVKNGTSLTLYQNGVSVASATQTATITDGGKSLFIGYASGFGSAFYLDGYVSNARIVKGTAVYTAAFTPPTAPLTNITNTSLLTCQSNRFVDNSTANSGSGFTITVNGTPSIQPFSPFVPSGAYTTTAVGGSGYFDGTGDYLLTQANSSLVAAGDFTVEAWFYCTQTGAYQGIIASSDGADTAGFRISIENTNVLGFWINGQSNTSTAVVFNQWNHVAMVRSGTASNNVSCYLNGARVAQLTNTASTTNNTVAIGRYRTTGTDQYWIRGFIASARLVVGSALYSGTTYTVPTAPLISITNTQLLLNFTNAGIVDSTAKNVLETVGNAQISTTQSKFGGSSIYLDGTGDWLFGRPNPLLDIGSGDFTFETWLYITSTIIDYRMIIAKASSTNDTYISLRGGGVGGRAEVVGSGTSVTISLNNTISQNTWTHFAVVRSGTTVTIYVNGTSIGTGTLSTNVNFSDGVGTYIGRWGGATAYEWPGYLDDLRITRFSRYTANFNVPTIGFTDR